MSKQLNVNGTWRFLVNFYKISLRKVQANFYAKKSIVYLYIIQFDTLTEVSESCSFLDCDIDRGRSILQRSLFLCLFYTKYKSMNSLLWGHWAFKPKG